MQITNVYERAFALLVSQFRDSKEDGSDSNWQKLIKSIAFSFQGIEDVNFELFSERWLLTAIGIQLDLIGELLGLARYDNESDEDYRFRLQTQIFINISKGTPEDSINLLRILTRASYIRYSELQPAAFQLETNGTTFPNPWNLLNESIKQVSPAGVAYTPITATLGVEIPFQMGGNQALDPFYVSPDAINLAQLEVDIPAASLLYVNNGNVNSDNILGGLAELNFPSPNAGQIAELIQIDGQMIARRYI